MSTRELVVSIAALVLIRCLGVADDAAVIGADEPIAASPVQAGDYTIRGRCLDRDNQQPVADVRLRLFVARGVTGPPQEIAETVSDNDGRFEFTSLASPKPEWLLERIAYGVVAQAENRGTRIIDVSFSDGQRETQIFMSRHNAQLTGRVIDPKGKPVQAATVSMYGIGGTPLPGLHSAITDAVGRFTIVDLPVVERREGGRVGFQVFHADFPAQTVYAAQLPAEVEFRLATGCTLTGTVTDAETASPAAGVVVTAQDHQAHSTAHTVTDAKGRYRLVVLEGHYNILAAAKGRVCVALSDRECLAQQTLELPPLTMIRGGRIAALVLNKQTGQPTALTTEGHRLTIGSFGPSQPPMKVISPQPLMEVDDDGRFLLRAPPGENFLYFVNDGRGDHMAWNTREQAPVIVEDGKTTNVTLYIVPPPTAAEKMERARQILATLPAGKQGRVAGIIAEFRKLNHTVDECETWCLLMRELVTIGKDGVPQLCAELDQTAEQRMLRRLGFALRAIGDPRAVPALIRAIPKTLLPSSSDYGLLVDDADLTAFMQQHDLDAGNRGQYFDLGRPVREVIGALQKLTRQNFDDTALYSVMLSEDLQRQPAQRRLYRRQAGRWQDWWEQHSREFTNDNAYRLVKLPTAGTTMPEPKPLGPASKVGGRSVGHVLSPPTEKAAHIRYFLDLDTGYEPAWPRHIAPENAADQMHELAAWAATEGIDLMCLVYRSSDGTETYALRGFNLQAWEITAREAANLEKLIRDGKLPEGQACHDWLLHFDPETMQYVPDANAAFVYITRERNMGLIEITDRVTKVVNLTGQFGSPPAGAGFHRGVRFNHAAIIP